jgi:hypothetical protein
MPIFLSKNSFIPLILRGSGAVGRQKKGAVVYQKYFVLASL